MMRNSKQDCPVVDDKRTVWDVAHNCAISCVEATPTADVVPRAEVERLRELNNNLLEAGQDWQKRAEQLEYILLGVMHSVDKWLDGEELEHDEVNRAATMREKTLQIVEGYQAQIRATIDFYEKREKEIFEEIEAALAVHTLSGKSEDYSDGAFDALQWVDTKLAEIKKKYTEGGTLIDNI